MIKTPIQKSLQLLRIEYDDGVLLLDGLIGHEGTMTADQIAAMKQLGDRLEYLESILDPIPPASRAGTAEEMAEYVATKHGEFAVA